MTTVGVIANPAAGKDIRRLVSYATHTSDAHKVGQIQRAVLGALEGGAQRVLCAPDTHHLAERALGDLGLGDEAEVFDLAVVGAPLDTRRSTRALREAGVGAVVCFGGDGTQREVAKAWLDCPLMPVSTGTNNVFPRTHEATTAGEAAGLIAAGKVGLEVGARRSKVLHVAVGEADEDLALVDVARVTERFIGSKAVWDATSITDVVACIAEPSSVGLSAIVARVRPTSRGADGAVHVGLLGGDTVSAPIAPGRFERVQVESINELDDVVPAELAGPCVLALDGERDRVLGENERAMVTVRRDGPWVIDPEATLLAANGREGN